MLVLLLFVIVLNLPICSYISKRSTPVSDTAGEAIGTVDEEIAGTSASEIAVSTL